MCERALLRTSQILSLVIKQNNWEQLDKVLRWHVCNLLYPEVRLELWERIVTGTARNYDWLDWMIRLLPNLRTFGTIYLSFLKIASIQSPVPEVLAIRNLTLIYYSFLDHSSNTYTLSETKLKAKPQFIKPTYAPEMVKYSTSSSSWLTSTPHSQ